MSIHHRRAVRKARHILYKGTSIVVVLKCCSGQSSFVLVTSFADNAVPERLTDVVHSACFLVQHTREPGYMHKAKLGQCTAGARYIETMEVLGMPPFLRNGAILMFSLPVFRLSSHNVYRYS